MKKLTVLFLLLPFYFFLLTSSFLLSAQVKPHRVIVIMTDGLRWQDVFRGMDPEIANNKKFHHGDSLQIFNKYWASTASERRQKLMPFVWSEVIAKGQIHGNREKGSLMNVANPYWFSYPGYSELTTGQVDTAVNSNEYKPNPNTNFFEYLNTLPAYKGKVVAFGAWDAFDRILNEQRAGFPVINAFDEYIKIGKDEQAQLLTNMIKDTHRPFGNSEVLDVFMHYQIMHYLKKEKPMAAFLSYGDTDEFAHEGNYSYYLDGAHAFDKYVKDIWNFVQADPDYKDNTTILITTDHGRGETIKSQWTSHGQKVLDSHQNWYMMLGKGVQSTGEITSPEQTYTKDLIHKVSDLMGLKFKSERK